MEITLLPVKMRTIQQEKDKFCEEARKPKEKHSLSKLDFVEKSLRLTFFIVPVFMQ